MVDSYSMGPGAAFYVPGAQGPLSDKVGTLLWRRVRPMALFPECRGSDISSASCVKGLDRHFGSLVTISVAWTKLWNIFLLANQGRKCDDLGWYIQNLVAVDPPAQSLTFWGFGGKPLDLPKVKV